jgi:hypothetical protein
MRILPVLLLLVACGTDDVTAPDGTVADVPLEPGPAVTSRLTRAQYHASVEDLFGPDLALSVALEPNVRVSGLEALGHGVAATSPRGVEQYEIAAYELAAQAVSEDRRVRWIGCTPAGTTDDDCAREGLSGLAQRAWRRPVTDAELDGLVTVSALAAETLDDFWRGLEFGVAAVLQSPHFLFRVEKGQVDAEGRRTLTPYEVATRLSFLLWDGPPDQALLDAAASGALDTPDGIDAEAQRMLEDPRAKQGLRSWLVDLLHLDGLDSMEKDPALFPNISPTLGAAAREETLLGAEHLVFTEDDDFRKLLTTRTTFVDRELAALYQVAAPELEGFAQVELPAREARRGLFGQVSFLALNSHSTSTSATLRGLAIREALLCDPPPPPPSGVDTSIPESDADKPTLRDRVESHLTVVACKGCHEKMDLLGLPFENYDAIGRWRDTENGYEIDASGQLDGIAFSGPAELGAVVQQDHRFAACLVRQVVRRALGREPAEGEEAALEALTASFVHRDGRVVPLWLDLVTRPLFTRLEAP